jgi:hypothetical protein
LAARDVRRADSARLYADALANAIANAVADRFT